MRLRTTSLVALVALLTAALVGAGVAVAKKPKADSTVKLESVTPIGDCCVEGTYRGVVRSPRGRCVKNRKVELFHKGVLIGEGRTDKSGNFKIDAPIAPAGDKVVAKLKESRRCKGDETSENIDELLFADRTLPAANLQ
jgi:hypothetical protein